MPNFNGAIIVHTLQSLQSPATLREIVVTIANHTDLSSEDLKIPVKQTLEMGERSGFLQKLNGRYFLVPMTFATLMSDMKNLDYDEDIKETTPIQKKVVKKPKKALPTSELDNGSPSNTTLTPSMKSKVKRPAVPSKR